MLSLGILYYGISNSIISFINLGIAGLFIFIILNTLIPPKMMDYSIHEAITSSNAEFLKKIFENLKLNGNPVYIPPYENLEHGGIFLPSNEKFSLNLSAFDENLIFITNQNVSNEMGVLISPPIGLGILKKFEENVGSSILNLDSNTAFSLIQSTLQSMNLIEEIDFRKKNGKLFVKIYKNKEISNFGELYYLSPVISSVFLAISKAKNVSIFIEEFTEFDDHLEFVLNEIK